MGSSFVVNALARLFTWNRTARELWARRVDVLSFPGIPWAPLRKEPRDCRVALVTTAGVHLSGDVPFDMEDRRGDPTFRRIPSGTPPSGLRITHDYYDHRDADRDPEIVFPAGALRELAAEGDIAEPAPTFYGFMGHIGKRHLRTLIRDTAPDVARRLLGERVDLVLLAPA